jgi:glycerol uptake facilitator-like aquaporin
LNPAVALAVAMVAPIQVGETFSDGWKYIWLYPVMPFIGTIFAVLYYEYVYKMAE